MIEKKILIIGSPGSGKTYFSEKLRTLGLNALDGDMIKGLCKWVDKEGNNATFPDNASKEWLNSHQFIWDKVFLKKWLNQQKTVYLFGMSGNIFEMFDLFDKVYFLDLKEEELRKRLDSVDRKNPMGKTEEQKQSILKSHKRNREKALNHGAYLIKATTTVILKNLIP